MNGSDAARGRLVVPVALSVMLAWLVSLGYAVTAGEYQPLTITTPVMLLLAGYVFGVTLTRKPDEK